MTDKMKRLEYLAEATDACIRLGEMDAMMILGREYHKLADEIKEETGVDPRPYAEVFTPYVK